MIVHLLVKSKIVFQIFFFFFKPDKVILLRKEEIVWDFYCLKAVVRALLLLHILEFPNLYFYLNKNTTIYFWV